MDRCDCCQCGFHRTHRHRCANCDRVYCNVCVYVGRTGLIQYMDGLFCGKCDPHVANVHELPDPEMGELVFWMIDRYCPPRMTLEDVLQEFKADMQEIAGVPCYRCEEPNGCSRMLDNDRHPNMGPQPNYYTLDLRKNPSQNLEGAVKPFYMEPRGLCCKCAQQESAECCGSCLNAVKKRNTQ